LAPSPSASRSRSSASSCSCCAGSVADARTTRRASRRSAPRA